MKIVHIGNFNPLETPGGVETVTLEVCQRLVTKNNTVTLLCFSKEGGSKKRIGNLKIIGLRCPITLFELLIPLPTELPLIFNEVRNADIVHAHMPSAVGTILSGITARIYKKPLILSLHNVFGMDIATEKRGLFYKPLTWLYNRLLFWIPGNYAVKIASPTPDYLTNSIYLENKAQKAIILPNGVDINKFNPLVDGTIMREKLGLTGFVILFVASLTDSQRGKGLLLLLDVIKNLTESGQKFDLKLVVVGDGEKRKDYESYVHRHGLDDHVFFIGEVDHETMPKYYALCDVLVLPTMLKESFGMVLLEAMACGKPVIGTKNGGVPFVIGNAGIIITPGDINELSDSIIRLMDDNGFMTALGEEGSKRSKEIFAWDKIINEYERLYDLILREG